MMSHSFSKLLREPGALSKIREGSRWLTGKGFSYFCGFPRVVIGVIVLGSRKPTLDSLSSKDLIKSR